MPRYARYLKLEKNIVSSDTDGIMERWKYGRELLSDPSKVTAAGHLQHGVLGKLIETAAKCGSKINEREIRRRLQAARTYQTEAEIGQALTDFGTWDALLNAGFPSVELPDGADPGDPYDPRTDREKGSDGRAIERLRERHAGEPGLPEVEAFIEKFNPPYHFRGDEHGPRSPLASLGAVCDESERYTAGMAKYDDERRAYFDELVEAAGGDLTVTWGEAEMRRGKLRELLDATGTSSLDSLLEIYSDWLHLDDEEQQEDDDE